MVLVQCNSPVTDMSYRTGINRASVALNLSVLSHYVSAEECATVLDPKSQPAALRDGYAEALVLVHRWPEDIAKKLADKWPTVSIVHHYPEAAIDYISIDDRIGMLSLVKHLAATGRKRIGFFGLCRQMSWACSRFAAYVEALYTLGLPYDGRNVVEISLEHALSPNIFAIAGWWQQVEACMKENIADAWICASASTSRTLCRTFLDRNYRMPEEVALAGYHRSASMPADLPEITSTIVADEELGAAAVRRILHRLDHPDETRRSILIPAKFAQGKTTAMNPDSSAGGALLPIA
jgi:LacI family transcriptional regulator